MLFRSRHLQDPVCPVSASLSPNDRGAPSESPGGDRHCPAAPAGPDLTSFSNVRFLQTLSHIFQRKDCVLSPHKAAATGHNPEKTGGRSRGRASFLTSSAKAALTVEAAFELPFFLICMVVILHYCVLNAVPYILVSILLFSFPLQYAPVTDISFTLPTPFVYSI